MGQLRRAVGLHGSADVAAASADLSADLPFDFLARCLAAGAERRARVVEAYRAASLEYALTVTPLCLTPPRPTAPGRTNCGPSSAGLRFLQAKKRLPAHMRRYYAPPEDIAPGGRLPRNGRSTPSRTGRGSGKSARSWNASALISSRSRGVAVACGRARGVCSLIFAGRSGTRSAPAVAPMRSPTTGTRPAWKVGQPDTDFGQRVSRAKSLREAGDLDKRPH